MRELFNYMQKEKQAADIHDAHRSKNCHQEMCKITGQRCSCKRKNHSTNDKDANNKGEKDEISTVMNEWL